MNIKETVKDILYIPIALTKNLIRSMIEPKMLLMYGIVLRFYIFLVFSIILDGRIPDTMLVTKAYKILLYMITAFDAYTVLVIVIRFFIELKREGILYFFKLDSEEDYEE